MPLFKGRTSLLEVQNQALIKTARERAMQINELERELKMAASRSVNFKVSYKRLKSGPANSNGTCRLIKTGPTKSNAISSRQRMRWNGSRWSAISIPTRRQH